MAKGAAPKPGTLPASDVVEPFAYDCRRRGGRSFRSFAMPTPPSKEAGRVRSASRAKNDNLSETEDPNRAVAVPRFSAASVSHLATALARSDTCLPRARLLPVTEQEAHRREAVGVSVDLIDAIITLRRLGTKRSRSGGRGWWAHCARRRPGPLAANGSGRLHREASRTDRARCRADRNRDHGSIPRRACHPRLEHTPETRIALLVGYCALMVAPAIILLVLRLTLRSKIETHFQRLAAWTERTGAENTAWILAIAGGCS